MNITEFFDAIRAGDIDTVRKALEAGMSPEVTNSEGQSALDFACFHESDEIADLLLSPPMGATQYLVPEIKTDEDNPICVVGYSAVFPGSGNSPDGFWQTLLGDDHKMTEVPEERWDADEYYSSDKKAPGKMYTKRGGFIECSPYGFDADFFKIVPKEAKFMDPQQRLTLEAVWYALEHAGIDPNTLREQLVGVYCGVMTRDYADMLIQSDVEHNNFIGTGNGISVLAGRVSYVFGMQGPSMTVGTACSSSLVTTHLAMRSLQNGECDVALAGGVNAMLAPGVTINCCKANMLAEDGVCKTFSDSADGYGRGEGVGMLVLKRYQDAIRDGNIIHGVIKGSAVNQDGSSSGLTVPNKNAQIKVIEKALASAGLTIDDIDFVEAHGTGTQLGDPIEINALKEVFAKRNANKPPVWVNSAKSYVGHLEAAAGVAGIVRLLESLKHQTITAKPIPGKMNPRLQLEGSSVSILEQNQAWPLSEDKVRRAGVSSFGFSGTNAHMIIEEPPLKGVTIEQKLAAQWTRESRLPIPTHPSRDDASQLLVLSARNEQALAAMVEQYVELLSGLSQKDEALWKDIAFSTQTGRAHHTHRLVFQADSIESCLAKLNAWHPAAKKNNLSKPDVDVFIPVLDSIDLVSVQRRYQNDVSFAAICDAELNQIEEEDAKSIRSCLKEDTAQILEWHKKAAKLTGMYALNLRYQRLGMPRGPIFSQGEGHFLAAVLDGRLSFSDMLTLFKVQQLKNERALSNAMTSMIVLDSEGYWSVQSTDLCRDLFYQRFSDMQQSSSGVKIILGCEYWLSAIECLYLSGHDIDWRAMWQGSIRTFQPLPLYPFQRQIYRFQAKLRVRAPRAEGADIKIAANGYRLEWSPLSLKQDATFSEKTQLLMLTQSQSCNHAFVDRVKAAVGRHTLILTEGERWEDETGYAISYDSKEDWQWFNASVAKRNLFRVIDLRYLDEASQHAGLLPFRSNVESYVSHRLYQTQMMFLSWPSKTIPGGYIACFPHSDNVSEDLSICHEGLKGQLRSIALAQGRMVSASMSNDDLSKALREMAGGQIDDVAIRYQNERWSSCKLVPALRNEPELRAPSYSPQDGVVITGGLGALGFTMAKWYAEQGIRHIALLSRRAPSEQQSKDIAVLEKKHDVRICVFQVDVTKEQALADTIAKIKEVFTIHSVYHLAGVPTIKKFEALTEDDYRVCISAKVMGAINLRKALLQLPYWPVHVILFSSVASLLPEKGQTAYNASNRMLDGLAEISQRTDKPMRVINWGLWGAAGAGAQAEFVKRIRKGSAVISEAESRLWLDRVLVSTRFQVAVLAIDWPIYQKHLTESERYFAQNLVIETTPSPVSEVGDDVRAEWIELADADRYSRIKQLVIDIVAKTSEVHATKLHGDTTFEDNLGLDSNVLDEIKDELQKFLGSEESPFPATLLRDHESIDALTQFLCHYLVRKKAWAGGADTPTDYIRELVNEREVQVKIKTLKRSKESQDPPLVLIHTIMGSVFFYRALVSHLNYNGAIYGIDNPYFSNLAKKFDSVEEMAKAYAEQITAQFDSQPIRLAGLSFAGAVAYEVAQQLADSGVAVDSVLMLDTAMPGAGHLTLPPNQRQYVMGEVADDINTYYQAEIDNNQRILNNYRPGKPKDGLRVILLKARSRDSVNRTLPSLNEVCNGWLHLFCPEVYSLPGSHFSMFDRTYVDTTAQVMRYAYDQNDYFIDKDLEANVVANRERLFLQAAKNGDSYLVVRLLKLGVNPLATDAHGITAAGYAALNDDLCSLAWIHYMAKDNLVLESLFPYAMRGNALKTMSYLVEFNQVSELEEPDVTLLMDVNKQQSVILYGVNKLYNQREWMEILAAHNESSKDDQPQSAMHILPVKKTPVPPDPGVDVKQTGKDVFVGERTVSGPAHQQPFNLMSVTKIYCGDTFQYDVVTKIRKGAADKPALFMFHAASGLALPYNGLGDLAFGDVYGFSNPYFGNQQGHTFASIEEMARHYLERMKQVQPCGPYYLAGWSLGGICAQAMASELERCGETVGIVIMIDSVNHFGKPYDPESERGAILKILESYDSLERYPGVKDAILRCYLNTSDMLQHYQAKPFSGRTVLLKADEHETNLSGDKRELVDWRQRLLADPFSGWGDLLPNFEILCVHGGHNQLFDKAYVKGVQQVLSNILATIKPGVAQTVSLSQRWGMNLVKALRRGDDKMINLLLESVDSDYGYQDSQGNLLDAIVSSQRGYLLEKLDVRGLNSLKTASGSSATDIALEFGLFDVFQALESVTPVKQSAAGFFGWNNGDQSSSDRALRWG
ncbi:MAG: SDR family NAD(P)-dependent oxidoreductase [Legionellaceae bacterium]|nr:SDR family NAD(P)-dependent oxidoreductase [Legionellaceae bacterium]